MSWNDKRVATLKELCGRPLTASEIASEFNGLFHTSLSRNAIIGKALRIGVKLPFAGQNITREARINPSPRPKRPRVHRQRVARITAPKIKAFRCEPAETDDGAPIDGGVSFDQLTHDCCRWPFGDPAKPGFRYCGQRRVEKATNLFCGFHLKRAWMRSAAA